MTDGRGQRSENRGQRTESRGQKAEIRGLVLGVPISFLNGSQNIQTRQEYFHQFWVKLAAGLRVDFGNDIRLVPGLLIHPRSG
jgi:hypothetical protein